jgi:uncharacterized protein (TIGR02246 family)
MKWNRLRAVAMFPAVLFVLSMPAVRGQSSPADADSAAIKQVVASYTSAQNRRDAHATAMCFAEDADFMDTTGESAHGRKEIEDFFARAVAGRLKAAKRKDTVRSIRFLTPEIVAEENDWEVKEAVTADGTVIPTFRGRHAWVMTKQNGQWFITVFHGMRLPS